MNGVELKAPEPLANGDGLRHRRTSPASPASSPRVALLKGENVILGPDVAPVTFDEFQVPPEHAHRSELAQLWLLSRIISSDPPKFRNGGEDRPVTLRNIRLALRIAGLIWGDVLRLFFAEERMQMAIHFLGKLIQGSIPACRIWASSAMLDLVQKSFEKGVEPSEVFRTAALNLLFHGANDIFRYLTQTNDFSVTHHIDYTFSKVHLRSQLSLSIPSLSSPYASALLHESGVMAGMEYRVQSNGVVMTTSPSSTLDRGLLEAPNILTQVITQVFLLLRTARYGETALCTWKSFFLVLLSLGPSILRMLGKWAGAVVDRGARRRDMREVMQRHRAVRELGSNGEYKQEVVLFGLRDWVMEKWETTSEALYKAHLDRRNRMGVTQLGLNMGQEGVQTAFYVLLALKVLGTNLSLGSIRLYQSTARALLDSIVEVGDVAEEVFHSIFYLAAYIEAMDIPEHPEKIAPAGRAIGLLVPYEEMRQADGMAIEAVDLGFTYPGSDKPTLRGINLSIPAGQTLAIVGFNGGGKTTLVKALMGLYDHTGKLEINGVEAKQIEPASIHKRTSCLFQDFSKYGLSLRENIGVGDVTKIMDDLAIERAIERGDAGQVRDKVGLEGELNRRAVAKPSEEGASISAKPVKPAAAISAPPSSPPAPGTATPTLDEKASPPSAAPATSNGEAKPTILGKVSKALGLERAETPESWLQDNRDKAQSLSGGQWQRVALSRAFLRADEADLVVFDEPSAALDPKAEAELFHRIHALSHQNGRKTTTIYISHRFSTVRKADRIAVVEDGTIIEQGTHVELISLQGRYYELYNLQAEGFIED